MLEVKYIGHQELDRKLKKLRKNLSKFSIVNKSVVIHLDKEIQQQFRTEGKHLTGVKWKDLKEETKKRRRNKTPPFRILQDVGFLRSKWQHIYTQRKAGIISKVPYGIYHDDPGPGSHLPKRKIIPDTKSKKFKSDILKIYGFWLKKQRSHFK